MIKQTNRYMKDQEATTYVGGGMEFVFSSSLKPEKQIIMEALACNVVVGCSCRWGSNYSCAMHVTQRP